MEKPKSLYLRKYTTELVRRKSTMWPDAVHILKAMTHYGSKCERLKSADVSSVPAAQIRTHEQDKAVHLIFTAYRIYTVAFTEASQRGTSPTATTLLGTLSVSTSCDPYRTQWALTSSRTLMSMPIWILSNCNSQNLRGVLCLIFLNHVSLRIFIFFQ